MGKGISLYGRTRYISDNMKLCFKREYLEDRDI